MRIFKGLELSFWEKWVEDEGEKKHNKKNNCNNTTKKAHYN